MAAISDLHMVIDKCTDVQNASLSDLYVSTYNDFRSYDATGGDSCCRADIDCWMDEHRDGITAAFQFLMVFYPSVIVPQSDYSCVVL